MPDEPLKGQEFFAEIMRDPQRRKNRNRYSPILGEHDSDELDSIQNPKLYGYELPKSLYMIYMHFNAGGKFIVKHLIANGFSGTLAEAEAALLQRAQGTGPADGVNFKDIVWKRPYYLTFVIDNDGWNIHWGLNGEDDPIRFLRRKPGSTREYITKNFTFYAAERVPHLGRGDAFRCINYHLREDGGKVLEGDPKKYCFQIYLEARFGEGMPNDKTHIVLIVDPDGQNQGPRT